MFQDLKRVLATTLIVAMIFSNAGMSTLASSVDDITENIATEKQNNNKESLTVKYYEESLTEIKTFGGDDVSMSTESEADDRDDDAPLSTESETDDIEDDAPLSTESEAEDSLPISTESEAEVVTSTKSEAEVTNSTKSEIEVITSTKSDVVTSTKSDIETFIATKAELYIATRSHFGSDDRYYIYTDWTAGNGVPDANITAVTILPYGYATPSTYDKAWDVPRSNGLKGYMVGTELFIHAPENKEIHFPYDSHDVFAGFSNLTVINNLGKVRGPEINNMGGAFRGCKKLKVLDLSNLEPQWVWFFQEVFKDCESLTEIIGLEKFSFQNTRTMLATFENCKSLKEINFGDMKLYNCFNVARLFMNCNNLTTIYTSRDIDISWMTYTDDMFTGCYNLRGGKYSKFSEYGADKKYARPDGGPEEPGYFTFAKSIIRKDWYKSCMENYDNSDITEIEFMNYGEAKPTGADFEWRLPMSYGLLGYRFGSKIYIYKELDYDIHLDENAMKTFSNYDAANYFTNLTSIKNFNLVYSDMTMELPGLFEGASSLTEIDLSSFDTHRFYSVQRMFKNCSSLATIKVSDKFDLSDVNYSDSTDMFAGCVSLVGKNLDGTPGTDAESSYSDSNPKNKTYALIEENYGDKHGYLTDGNYRFSKDWNKDINDVTKINKSDVTKLSFTYKQPSSGDKYEIKNSNGLFAYIVNTTEVVIYAKNERNIYTAVDASELFKDMTSLVDITNFDLVKTRKAENMASMFENCNQLTSIDLSQFDTLRVTNMSKMFRSLRSLTNIDLINFKTSKVTTFEESFADMDALLDINLSDFDTSNTTNFSKAFEGSSNIKSIDIGNFTVSQTANISNMFKDLPNLENIYCKNSFIVDATDIVFDNCPKLVGDNGTKFSVDGAKDDTYARMDGGVSNPGYFSKPIYRIARGWYLGSEIEPSQITKLTILKNTDPIDPSAYSYAYDVPSSNGLRGYVNAVQKEITIYAPSAGDISFGFDASYVFSGETEKFTALTAIEGLYNTSTKTTQNMSYMFDGAISLKSVDAYNFETQNVTNMSYMFNGCSSLETIKAHVDFVVTQVTNSDNMFNGCVSLIGKDMDGNPSTNPSSIYSETNPKDKTLAIIEKDYDTATDTHGYLSDGSYRLASGWYYAYGTKDASWSPNNITKIVFASTSSMKPTSYDYTWNIPGSNGLIGYREGQVVTIYADKTYPIYAAKNSSGLFANKVSNFYDVSFGWTCGGCEFENLHFLNTSKVTSFFAAFKNVQFPFGTMSFNGFDTKGVENFSNMFSSSSDNVTRGSTVRDNPWSSWLGKNENVELDLSSFYFGDAISLNGLLYNSGYKKVSFAKDMDTPKVTSIRGMFAHAYNLESIDRLNLGTSVVDPIEMEYLFIGCKKLKKADLSSFDTTNITSYKGLFVNCEVLETIYVSDKWKEISGGSDYVFNGCNMLVGEAGSTKASIALLTSEADSNKDTYARVDKDKSDVSLTGLLTDGNYVLKPGWFRSANETGDFSHRDITTIKFVPYGEAIMSDPDYVWEIPDSYHLMACRKDGNIEIYKNRDRSIYAYEDSTQLFSNAGSYSRDIGYRGGMDNLTSITNLNLLDTSRVATMSGMFAYARKLTSLDVSGFDTSKVKKMDLMFHFMDELTSLDLSNFDTSKVTDMYCMFSYDDKLSSLDISNFDTSKVTDMGYMFGRVGTRLPDTYYASIVGIDKFDTSNVTNMKSMFYYSHLTGHSLNFESFDTSKVTNMETMFWDMKTDTTILALGSFDTSNVTNFNEMLSGVNVTTIYASDTFVVNSTATNVNMFSGASNLVGEKGTSHSAAGVNDGSYARIDEGPTSTSPGYFTTDHYILSPNWYDGLGATISEVQYIRITPYTEALPTNPISSKTLPNSGGLKVYYYMTSSNEPTLRIHLSRDKEIYTAADASYLFSGPTDDTKFSSLKSFTNLSYLNAINTTNMSHMFDGAMKVREIDVSNFETFNVTDMSYMFYNCEKLNKIKATDNFDVTNVTNSYYMFKNCHDIESYMLSGVPVLFFGYMDDKVDKSMAQISVYDGQRGYLSDFNYEFDISWQTYDCWSKCVGLNIGQVTKLTLTYDKNDIPANIEAEGTTSYMPGLKMYRTNGTEVVIYAKQRRTIYASSYSNEGFSRGRWSNIQEINGMEYLDFTKVEDAVNMFEGWRNVPIDLSNVNFRVLEDAKRMFSEIPDLSIFNFDGMKLPSVNWVTDMFEYTGDKSELAENEIIDLSTVQLGSTENIYFRQMNGWFDGRSKTKKIILPEECYSERVTTMRSMFKDCESLEEIVWNNLDTTAVKDMSRMFMNCKKFKELDLNLLSSDDLTNIEQMFDGCEELETIYISKDFDVSDVTKSDNAFNNCYKLVGGSGTKWIDKRTTDPDYHNKKYAHIDLGSTSLRPGYFTYKSYLLNKDWYQDTTYDSNNIVDVTILGFGTATPSSPDSDWEIPNSNGLRACRDGDSVYIYPPSNKEIYTARDASYLFGCDDATPKYNNLTRIINFNLVNTNTANNMSSMFRNTPNLATVSFARIDTTNTTDMSHMFEKSSLDSLNLTTFDTHNVEKMEAMFKECGDLKMILASYRFATSSVIDGGTDMFLNDNNLVGGEGTRYDTDPHNDLEYARIDASVSLGIPGYFTEKTLHMHKACGIDGALDCKHSLKRHGEVNLSYTEIPLGLNESEIVDFINGEGSFVGNSPYILLSENLGSSTLDTINLSRDVYICLNGYDLNTRFTGSHKAVITNCKNTVSHIASTSLASATCFANDSIEMYGQTFNQGINYYSNIQLNAQADNVFENNSDSYIFNIDVVDSAYDKFIKYDNSYTGSDNAITLENVDIKETLHSLGGLDQVFVNNSSSIAKVSIIECVYSGKINPGKPDVQPGRPVKGFINVDGGGEVNISKGFEIFGVDCLTGYPLINVTNGSTYKIKENPDPEGLTYRNSIFGADADHETLFNVNGGILEVGTESEISFQSNEIRRDNATNQSILNLNGEANIYGKLNIEINAFTYAIGPATSIISAVHSGTNSINVGGESINIDESNEAFVGAGWESDRNQEQNVFGIYSEIDDYNTPLFTQVPGTKFYYFPTCTIENIGFKHNKYVGYIIKNWNQDTALFPASYPYIFKADTTRKSTLKVEKINDTGEDDIVITDFYTVSFTSTVSIASKYLEPQTIRYKGTASEVLPKPTATNYDFVGWFYRDALNVEREFDFTAYLVEDDLTVYAKWEDHKYTATFDSKEGRFPGDITISTKSFIYNELITYPTNPSRDGFEFKGYKLGSEEYIPGGTAKHYSFNEDKTFVAFYDPYTYTIKFNANAPVSPDPTATNTVSGAMSDITDAKSTIPKKLTNNNYTLTGYTFIGWATASYTAPEAEALRDAHSNLIVPDSANVTFKFNASGQVVDLYALWTRNKYNIYIKTNYENASIPDPYVASGEVLFDQLLVDTGLFNDGVTRGDATQYQAFTGKFTFTKIPDAYDRKLMNVNGVLGTDYLTKDSCFRYTTGKDFYPLWLNVEYDLALDIGEEGRIQGFDINPIPFKAYFDAPLDQKGPASEPKIDGKILTPVSTNSTIRTFDYWSVFPQGSGKINTSSPFVDTSITTLYAIYRERTKYRYSFNKGDQGQGQMNTIEVYEGLRFQLPPCAFTPASSYTFDYWQDADGNKYGNAAWIDYPNKDLSFTAIWKYQGGGGGRGPGGGGSGGSGGGGAFNPLSAAIPAVIKLDTVKTIKDSLNYATCAWNYNPTNNKWQLKGKNASGRDVEAKDGFYIVAKLANVINPTIHNVIIDTYYFDKDGNMYTGWVITSDNKSYFFNNTYNIEEGIMAIGWKQVLADWYYFKSDGAMLVSSITPDGYLVGADGKWTTTLQ